MAGTKRMSLEEKRKVILGIYHKTMQVYTEKEIHAAIAKAGVSANTVEDVHKGLVDDFLVDKEKIGGTNYFWSFPTKKERRAQAEQKEIIQTIAELKVKLEEASAKLADAKRGREDDGEGDDSRSTKLAKLSDMDKVKKVMENELETLKENDPAALADLQKELKLTRAAVERWTDNIFLCKDYLVKKRGMQKKEAMKFLGIKDDFDYLEDD